MNWKVFISVMLIGLALFALALFFPHIAKGYMLDARQFELGNDISPMPAYGDCDDAVLYSYIYLKSMRYEPVIMYGKASYTQGQPHVWLEVDDWIYDMGIAHQEFSEYNGKEITYRQLLGSAMLD